MSAHEVPARGVPVPGGPVPGGRVRTYAPGRATKARIVDAACRLMWERGVNATTLDDVREASGTSKSQLYQHFANKEALVRSVIEQNSDIVLSREERLLAGIDSVAGLRMWADALVALKVDDHGAYGCLIGSMANELADQDDGARAQLDETLRGWERLIAGALERMKESGRLAASVDTARLATGVLAAVQGGFVLARTARSVEPLRAAVELVVGHVESLGPDARTEDERGTLATVRRGAR